MTYIQFGDLDKAESFYLDQYGRFFDHNAPNQAFNVLQFGPTRHADWVTRKGVGKDLNYAPIICSIDGDCALKCSGNPGNGYNVSTSDTNWRLSDANQTSGNAIFDPYVVLA